MLLHLLVLLDLGSSPTLLPSLLSRHVEANTGPSKTHFGVLSMRAMPIAVTGIPNLIFLQIQICFWWTCRGSNPGPQRLRFEGITTILYLRFFITLRAVALTERAWCARNFAILLTFLSSSHCGFTDTFFCDWSSHFISSF